MLFLEAMESSWHRELEYRRLCYPGIKHPESWTEGLKKVGIPTTARETAPPNMKLHGVRGTVVDPYWTFIIRLLYAATVDRIAE
jgi:hypothetical protein